MKGLVSRLLPQSFVDGPGNRAVIFLQGCPLRCLYCHNPQTHAVCNSCGACVPGCPGKALSLTDGLVRWDPALCQGCDRCITVCPHRADPRAQWLSPDDLLAWLEPLRPFLSGITLSGGEPLLQPEFVAEVGRHVRALGLTVMIETSSAVPWSAYEQVLPHLDGVLADLKGWDEARHHLLTGHDGRAVKENLRRLGALGKLAEVRVPVIPGFTDAEAEIAAIAAFLAGIGAEIPLRLQRFRTHGTRGPASSWVAPELAQMDRLVAVAQAAGLAAVSRSR